MGDTRMLRPQRDGPSGIGAVLALFLAVILALGSPVSAALAGSRADRAYLLTLINQDRAQHGVRNLKLDGGVSHYAKRHSKRMALRSELFHTRDLAAHLKHRNWHVAGENVGYAPTLDDLYDAFMSSRSHRRNILRKDYDHVAIGVYWRHSQVWATLIFYG